MTFDDIDNSFAIAREEFQRALTVRNERLKAIVRADPRLRDEAAARVASALEGLDNEMEFTTLVQPE